LLRDWLWVITGRDVLLLMEQRNEGRSVCDRCIVDTRYEPIAHCIATRELGEQVEDPWAVRLM